MAKHRVVGTSPLNIDALEKVTGAAKYCMDLALPGMLHAKVKRSPCAHARIVNIDVSRAKALAGVWAVITAKDFPDPGDHDGYRPPMAAHTVRHIAEPVAAVAAESLSIAEKALELIDVTYEELPAIFDPEEAMRPDTSVVLHPSGRGENGEPLPPNVSNYHGLTTGDVEAAFREAHLVVENRYTTAMVQHVPMEAHVCISQVDSSGDVTCWTNTQTAYSVKNSLSEIFKMPPHRVRVIVPPHIGGAFGNKVRLKGEAISTALAKAARRPVKYVYTREEVFTSTTVRHPFVVYVKDGVTREGKIIARQIKTILSAGAYTEGTVGYLVTRNCGYGAVGAYSIPNFKMDNYRVYTNQPVAGAFRGFGVAQMIWALESNVAILAENLQMDPLEFRLKNLMQEGEINADGQEMYGIGARECLQKAVKSIWWDQRPKSSGHLRRGTGIALGTKHFAINTSSATVRVCEDGSIEVRSSAVDLGQGVRTILSQIAAEEFQVALDKVRVVSVDTLITPFDTGQVGSSTTVKAGNAVRMACSDAKKQLFAKACMQAELHLRNKIAVVSGAKRSQRRQDRQPTPEDLDTADGKIFVKGSEEDGMPIANLFTKIPYGKPGADAGPFLADGAEIVGKATWYPAKEKSVRGGSLPRVGYAYIAQAVEVEVDTETGGVKVLNFVDILDPGVAINPLLIECQLEGGVGTGIGTTLLEEMLVRNGKVLNPDLTDYRVPTAKDVPFAGNVKLGIVETSFDDGPYGAKGMGEIVLTATAPAIATAIYNAVGVRFKDLPITPERVLLELSRSNPG